MTQGPSPSAGGLEGVVVGETRLSRVDGPAGRLTLAGYSVETLAPAVSFERALHLLWHDRLPTQAEAESLCAALEPARRLPEGVLEVLRRAAAAEAPTMSALRLGVAALEAMGTPDPGSEPDAARHRIVGAMPAIVAAYCRLRDGLVPVAPAPESSHAAGFLGMLHGEPPSAAAVRALDTYLVTICDHGMNASTFVARVVASTRSDLGASVEAALGALQGPLHGGAPGPVLDALRSLLRGDQATLDERTRAWVREEVAAGRRVMGFGHRVYQVRDPRADVLREAARGLLAGTTLLEDAGVHERAVLETLRELKPGRRIETNVEFYTALLLHGLRIPAHAFTAVFAIGRVAGWTAHVTEQAATGRLIRPRASYAGAERRTLAG